MSQKKINVATAENQIDMLKIIEKIISKNAKRYTVRIDKNNSNPYNRIEYMDDAVGMIPAHMDFKNGVFDYGSWEDVWFIKYIYPVMLKSNGTVDYKLNPNDYTKKEDGTASDVANADYDGNAMVRFPKVYISFRESARYEYISVCSIKYDETYEAIGFIDDKGHEVHEIFLAMFEGSDPNSSGKLRSLSGYSSRIYEVPSAQIAYAKANGTGWYTRTWAQRQMVNALLTIISKSDNSQEAFGYGVSLSFLNSGTLNDKGQFFGYDNSSQTKAVKVFHMENWWGNHGEQIAGALDYQGKIYIKMRGPYNDDPSNIIDFTGYNIMNTISSYSYGYITSCKCNNACGRLPVNLGGSSSTYLCDQLSTQYSSNSGTAYCYYPTVGGQSISPIYAEDSNPYTKGMNTISFYTGAKYSYSSYTASLSYMPEI